MDRYRMVVISDCHMGHRGGYPAQAILQDPKTPIGKRQLEMRAAIDSWISKYRRPDILLLNGDAIEGKGPKSGSTELLITDRIQQCNLMSEELLKWEASTILMTYGTAYHTGKEEDFEDIIAKQVNAIIRSFLSFDVLDTRIFAKHHLGGSQSPSARFSALSREAMWDLVKSDRISRDTEEDFKSSDILLFSHNHLYGLCEDRRYMAMCTPALCSGDGKFGNRRLSSPVDFGILVFDIQRGNRVSVTKEMATIPSDIPEVLKFI